jgi:hypothetical protein
MDVAFAAPEEYESCLAASAAEGIVEKCIPQGLKPDILFAIRRHG